MALGQPIGAESGDVRLSVFLRRIEERDRPWLIDLCKRRYPPHYSIETADAWITNVVLKNPIQFYATRTSDAFQITNLTTTAWAPKTFRADIVAACADRDRHWQLLTLFRDSIVWARDRHAHQWRFESETDYDLKPIMTKLRATSISPRYHMEL